MTASIQTLKPMVKPSMSPISGSFYSVEILYGVVDPLSVTVTEPLVGSVSLGGVVVVGSGSVGAGSIVGGFSTGGSGAGGSGLGVGAIMATV